MFDGGLLVEDAEVGKIVFDFLEGPEHGGFVVGRGLGFVLVAGLVGEGVALAGVEEQLRGLGAEASRARWGPESRCRRGCFQIRLCPPELMVG